MGQCEGRTSAPLKDSEGIYVHDLRLEEGAGLWEWAEPKKGARLMEGEGLVGGVLGGQGQCGGLTCLSGRRGGAA